MNLVFYFIVVSLCAYRLTRLIVEDGITEPIRDRIFARFPHTKTRQRNATFVGRLLECHWCMGVWVSAGLVGAGVLMGVSTPLPVIFGGAVAGVQGLVGHIERKLDS